MSKYSVERLREATVADLGVTDAQVRSFYDETLAADPNTYRNQTFGEVEEQIRADCSKKRKKRLGSQRLKTG